MTCATSKQHHLFKLQQLGGKFWDSFHLCVKQRLAQNPLYCWTPIEQPATAKCRQWVITSRRCLYLQQVLTRVSDNKDASKIFSFLCVISSCLNCVIPTGACCLHKDDYVVYKRRSQAVLMIFVSVFSSSSLTQRGTARISCKGLIFSLFLTTWMWHLTMMSISIHSGKNLQKWH